MLSKCENKVLELAAKGLKNQDIAKRLNVQANTINAHLMNIYAKLNIDESLNQRVAAVVYFLAMEKTTSNDVDEKGG